MSSTDPAVGSFNHLTLSVRDVARSFAFYVDVVGLKPLARWNTGAYLLAGGDTWVCITLDSKTRSGPSPEYTHVAFSVARHAFGAVAERLRAGGARQWQDNKTEGESIYFLDPDGHKLEVHVGDWRSRLAACRERPFDGMEFLLNTAAPRLSWPRSHAPRAVAIARQALYDTHWRSGPWVAVRAS